VPLKNELVQLLDYFFLRTLAMQCEIAIRHFSRSSKGGVLLLGATYIRVLLDGVNGV